MADLDPVTLRRLNDAAKLLDLLGVPAGERQFDRLGNAGKRLAPGSALPAPAPVFPRYVEPEAAKA